MSTPYVTGRTAFEEQTGPCRVVDRAAPGLRVSARAARAAGRAGSRGGDGLPGAAPIAAREPAARAAAGHSSRRVRPVALRGRAAGRAGAAARLEEDRSHRAAGGPLAAHSPGIRDPGPRQFPGGEAHRVLRRAPRIPAARL